MVDCSVCFCLLSRRFRMPQYWDMAEPDIVGPIVPRVGGQEAAAQLLKDNTATDRRIIEEKRVENGTPPFLDVLKDGALNPKVENEETTPIQERT